MTGSRISMRRPMLLGLAATLVLVAGFGVWATTTRIAGAIVAPGQIEVEKDRQVVQHPDGGVVEAILVAEGARVAAGDPLLLLDGAALRSELAIVEGQLTELSSRSARLIAERDGAAAPDFPAEMLARAETSPDVAAQIDGQLRLFEARAATLAEQRALLTRRIDQIRAQSNGIAAQQAALATQLDLIERELASQQGLFEKGLAQAGTVLALQREQARLQGQLGELAADLARTEDQVTEIEIEISSLATRRREEATAELRQIGPMILELAERRRALAERIDRLEIRAPVSGVVLGLQVTTPRAVLRPADPVLFVIPQDRPLVITARIAPIHIDEVAVGQTAELVFPAFSARDTPHLKGRVTLVSADALTDPQTGVTYYRAELQLDEGEQARLGDRVLLPGMPVEVFLQTGRRTPLAYLVKPFTDYFVRAFRES
ncbi:HlyD family type I secretion periplasmic adaptor subunit [Rhodobacter calidifons]|uniref:Membrane fusion protein (MFP) family protein n=1 Tax=Rhodobacter calidifons TaxID=2715277 RepID=A0ABX0G6E2_9RHOB|nr:HlyD family type I secretion periplasmic adaptor subunit [Rhodobacter calidifons]NHB76336.1 HlyD family type I secretion periplasmic adaptor subunit [Rhodobacter calidifons]